MTGVDNIAGSTARSSAELTRTLANLSLPAIKEALSAYTADLGQPGEEPSSIRKAYGDLRSNLTADYEANRTRGTAYIKQQALQSGMNYNPAAVTEATSTLAQNLGQSEAQQMRAINFQEAQAGMNQTNSLLSNITGTAGNLLTGGLRFGNNALQSDAILRQYQEQARQQNSVYGSMAGSIIGGVFGSIIPGLGTAAGAGLGGALGGAAGGFYGGGY